MTGTIQTGVTTIVVAVLFKGGTRTLVSGGNVRRSGLITFSYHLSLHGVRTFMNAIDCDDQHDQKNDLRNGFQWDQFSQSSLQIMSDSS
jgi:hypothetical protein